MMMTARTTIKIRFWMILKKNRRDKRKESIEQFIFVVFYYTTAEYMYNYKKKHTDKYLGEKARAQI